MAHRQPTGCLLALAFGLAGGVAEAAALGDAFTVSGHLSAGASRVAGPPGWLEGGFGRLPLGGDASGDASTEARGDLHLTVEWLPSTRLGAFVHTTARVEPSTSRGRAAGVVEAYLHGDLGLGSGRRLHWRLGHFILPTSRENREIGWSSPYTLTFSALNSWIGEEIRPTGTWTELALPLGAAGDEIRFGGSLFGGNDTSGALLAWRGWSLHDRLTGFGEHLPLPPLASLAEGGGFAAQSDRGTEPFGDDLDGRVGWAAQASWRRFERAAVVFTRYDNRADRGLYAGQYAWENDFDLLGAEWHGATGAFSLLAEAIRGTTGMGPHAGPHYVQAEYRAGYLLASWAPPGYRLSLRWDRFETEHLQRGTRSLGEDGDAWTLATFWEPTVDLRLGLELLEIAARRPAALPTLGSDDVGGATLRLEARYYLDFP